jgi:hypothetical protein
MEIRIDATTATLAEPDDFKAFRVVVKGDLAPDAYAAAVAPFGRIADADHVFVTVEGLKRLAGERAQDPQWNASLDGMLGYAASQGWLADDGAIRAHVD